VSEKGKPFHLGYPYPQSCVAPRQEEILLKIKNKKEQVKVQLIIGTRLNPSDQAFASLNTLLKKTPRNKTM
jgi:serine protease inhibitor ecotin